MISTDKYTKFSYYQEFLKKISTLSKSIEKCLIFFSNSWVINFNITDHMTDNTNIFFSFRPHKKYFLVTIVDWLTYNIVISETTKPTSCITLSFVFKSA